MMHNKRQGRAWYHWFAESDTPAERKLILKLDLLIVPYAFIGFWVSYIDSVNISKPFSPDDVLGALFSLACH